VVREALAAAKVLAADISFCCAGVAGVSLPEVRTVIEQVLREHFSERFKIVGDDQIALEAAFFGLPGIVVIAGTGSICVGRNSRGHVARAGGYGPIVSDEGSGTWLGRRAVSRVLLSLDAGATGHLSRRILQAWDCSTQDDLLHAANTAQLRSFANLFPQIVGAESEGDGLSGRLLSEAGRELGRLVAAVYARLGEPEEVLVKGTGGVLEHSATVRAALEDELRAVVPKARYDSAIVEPAQGALYLATQAAERRP
jgi:N-acetylglucosamine kinase-like BadF-type ATPase